jgi:hypothetical protein
MIRKRKQQQKKKKRAMKEMEKTVIEINNVKII